MYDLLGWVIIVKVFSHQLNPDFKIKNHGNTPSPNLVIVSANQIADNADTMAHNIHANYGTQDLDQYYYPPFSTRWCFSFEGKLTNKGATNHYTIKLTKNLYYNGNIILNKVFIYIWHLIIVWPQIKLEMSHYNVILSGWLPYMLDMVLI